MDEREIFEKSLDFSDFGEREAFLAGACGDDTALRARVEALLRSHEEAGSFLQDAPVAGVELTLDQPISEKPGTQLGPYKLLQQIGEGGMGVVWMAEQKEPIHRRVAVKVIKAGMDSKQVLARFEAERQTLALMDHPNIARVLDAGVTDAGRPYFVMELVKGAPITQYCDDKHLPVRARLELFGDVCRAVQHAHQKGIIHRDLKPSNILIAPFDGKSVVKVIDFGVAKATGQRLTDATLFTGFGAIVGTPEYMSPEQAETNNQDIDTRSDIYSLGVLLYELLTGSTPLTRNRVKEAALLEVLRVIREEEPPKPSTRLSSTEELPSISVQRETEPAKLTRLVRGELDWIVMKALEKDRGRRYETAGGFAQDVQRYLADEPVQACPPSASYRLRKFARRHKGGLAVATLVLFFLVLLGSSVGWAVRDRIARQTRVGAQVGLILGDVDRLEREQKWSEALAAARQAEAAAVGGEADAAVEGRVRQRLKGLELIDRLEQARMAEATSLVGDLFDASAADREYARAFHEYGLDVDGLPVETAVERLKEHPTLVIPVAAALDNWAHKRWGAQSGQGDDDAAKRLMLIARGIDPEPLRDRVRATWRRPDAEVADELRRVAESIDVRTESPATLLILYGKLIRVKQPDRAVRLLRDAQRAHPGDFWVNFVLARDLGEQNDYEGAVRFYTAALAARPTATSVLLNLGSSLYSQKKFDEAVAVYRRAIQLEPKDARTYNNLGNALTEQQKLDEAIEAYRKSIELGPKDAIHHSNLGRALYIQKKLDGAVAAFRKAIELDPKDARAYGSLGIVLREQKKLDEAVAAHHKAIELDPKDANEHLNLGAALVSQKKLDEAVACFKRAIELDPKNLTAYLNLGAVLYIQKKLDEAIEAYRKVIELDPKSVSAYTRLGNALRDQKRLDEAVAAFRKAIELDPKYAGAHSNLGAVLYNQKKLDEAIAAFRKAVELDPKHAGAHSNLGAALRELKKLDEAVTCYQKAIELDPKFTMGYHYRAQAYAALGHWAEAAADFQRTLELDPKNDDAWRLAAYAYLAAGDAGSYRRTCRELVERFGQTDDPVMAERTAKVCLLAPGAVADFRVVERLAQVAMTGTEQHGNYHYFVLAKGLTEDRAGRHAEAVQWLERFAPQADRGWDIDAITFSALAMAQHRLGRADEAKEYLAVAKAIVAEKMPDPSKGRLIEGNWHDWLHAEMLSREAEGLIGAVSQQELASLRQNRLDRKLDQLPHQPQWDSARMRLCREIAGDAELFGAVRKLRPDDADLSIARGQILAWAEKWDEAAGCFARVIDRRGLSEDAFQFACLHLLTERPDAYRQFCTKLIGQAGEVTNPDVAFVLARTCILVPEMAASPEQVLSWAEQAASRERLPWRLHVLGAASCRAGQYSRAIELLEESTASKWSAMGEAQNALVLAIAHKRQGNSVAATECLDRARALMAGADRPPPPDWLEYHVLVREAEGLMEARP